MSAKKKIGIIGKVPVISMPEDTDYRWQLGCLIDRLEHLEKYEHFEDVGSTIAELQQWLFDYEDEHPAFKTKRLAGYYAFIEERYGFSGSISEIINQAAGA